MEFGNLVFTDLTTTRCATTTLRAAYLGRTLQRHAGFCAMLFWQTGFVAELRLKYARTPTACLPFNSTHLRDYLPHGLL